MNNKNTKVLILFFSIAWFILTVFLVIETLEVIHTRSVSHSFIVSLATHILCTINVIRIISNAVKNNKK